MADTITITEEEVAAFVARCQAVVDAHTAANFPNLTSDLLVFDYGAAKKYCRVVSRRRHTDESGKVTVSESGSAWCFVDLTNGDVLKCDGFKKPAKHSRGNIRNPDGGMSNIGRYGPAYLK